MDKNSHGRDQIFFRKLKRHIIRVNTALAYLGVSHIHNVLVSLDALHDIEAVTVQHLGLRVAGNYQDDITCDAVLQRLDLMAEDAQQTTQQKILFF